MWMERARLKSDRAEALNRLAEVARFRKGQRVSGSRQAVQQKGQCANGKRKDSWVKEERCSWVAIVRREGRKAVHD